MPTVPTVNVTHKESGTPMSINVDDYDPEIHEMAGAKKESPKKDDTKKGKKADKEERETL